MVLHLLCLSLAPEYAEWRTMGENLCSFFGYILIIAQDVSHCQDFALKYRISFREIFGSTTALIFILLYHKMCPIVRTLLLKIEFLFDI